MSTPQLICINLSIQDLVLLYRIVTEPLEISIIGSITDEENECGEDIKMKLSCVITDSSYNGGVIGWMKKITILKMNKGYWEIEHPFNPIEEMMVQYCYGEDDPSSDILIVIDNGEDRDEIIHKSDTVDCRLTRIDNHYRMIYILDDQGNGLFQVTTSYEFINGDRVSETEDDSPANYNVVSCYIKKNDKRLLIDKSNMLPFNLGDNGSHIYQDQSIITDDVIDLLKRCNLVE